MTRFFAAEVETAGSGSVVDTLEGWGVAPWGVMIGPVPSIASTGLIRVSDVGYRTAQSDPDGVQPYLPLIRQAFAIDRRIPLDPTNAALAASWGSLSLANPGGYWDGLAGSQNADGRRVRVYSAFKTFDLTRGYDVDPAFAALALIWKGLAQPWFCSDTSLDIPLRDASYWFERPIQSTLYLGTGTYEGTADLTGKPKPKARGGTFANPIQNVTPVLVDPAFLIYQYSDARGTVAALYEGGFTAFTTSGDVADLYSGSTAAGHYRTDNARGLFQLGSVSQHQITADVTGQFPGAGVKTNITDVIRYLIAEELATPSDFINTASFVAAASAFGAVGGIYFDTSPTQGAEAVTALLQSCGAVLYPARDGTLNIALPWLPLAAPADSWDTSNLVSLIPRKLPAVLDPPVYLWRLLYQQNYTTMTSDLSASATAARISYLATPGRTAAFASSGVASTWNRPNAPDPFGGCLLAAADAQTVVNGLGARWGIRRRLYDAMLPIEKALPRDLGDVVAIRFPMDNLAGGQVGQIVGEQFSSDASTITYQVLV